MLQIPKQSALREELVHRQHQELKLLSSVSGRAQHQDPHHCQVRCLVHLPKQHLKWAPFSGISCALQQMLFHHHVIFFKEPC